MEVTGRPTTLGLNGMVATPHYLASAAGLHVLRSGGNAVDAAIAANAVLTVVYPHMCSIGGDAFALVWDPRTDRLRAINGSGRSARAQSVDQMRRDGFAAMPIVGAFAVTVPGAVDAWAELLDRYGTRSLSELLQPAIGYARDGFPVSPSLSLATSAYQALLRESAACAAQFLPTGLPLALGEVLRQPALAATLERLALEGRESFYRGSLGAAIVAQLQAHGAPMTLDDFASHRSEWVDPLQTSYRGVDLVELPPNSQGAVSLLLANIVEGFDLAASGHNTVETVHCCIEAKKLAFEDRDRYIGDPDFFDVPVQRLTSKEYAAKLRARIDRARAAGPPAPALDAGDTVYLCAVDRDGLAISLIQSLFTPFGSGIVAGDTGVLLQCRGASFTFEETAANRLEPGKRPMHTLIPGMLLRDGRPWVVFGTMGGHGQVQTHLQLLCNLVDFGLEPQPAIEAPRWVSGRGRPGDPPDVVYLEPGVGNVVVEGLRARGHDARMSEPWSSLMGHAQMIEIDRVRGVFKGGADPRADSLAVGW